MSADADAARMVEEYRTGLDEGRPQARASLGMIGNKYTVDWTKYAHVDMKERVQTNVTPERLRGARRAHRRACRKASRCIRASRR